ncbi:hypothetical protein GDO81_028609 [Engystomops pustulosus]|uniref:Uncharacterized protein n=1 Tax=Engystomops pustulosus TaxID=76066 RepID=A0AAV6ZU33_ENGPU|nr:hypothetical protein GDO81_028609 [Engystomops pustulosus]
MTFLKKSFSCDFFLVCSPFPSVKKKRKERKKTRMKKNMTRRREGIAIIGIMLQNWRLWGSRGNNSMKQKD